MAAGIPMLQIITVMRCRSQRFLACSVLFLQPAHLDELLAGLDDGALTIEQQQRFEMLAGWG